MSTRQLRGRAREQIITVHMETTGQAAFLWAREKEGRIEHLEVVPRPKKPSREPKR